MPCSGWKPPVLVLPTKFHTTQSTPWGQITFDSSEHIKDCMLEVHQSPATAITSTRNQVFKYRMLICKMFCSTYQDVATIPRNIMILIHVF
eukprot:2822856-Amphidinium_carterae.1